MAGGKSASILIRILGDNKGATDAVNDTESVFAGMGDKLKKAGLLAGAAGGAALTKGLLDAMGQQDVAAFFQAQLGSSEAGAAELGRVASGAYRDAWGASLEETAATVAAVAGTFGDDVSYDWIETMTGRFTAFADTFETSTADAVNNVNVMLSAGLVDSAEEGLDLLTVALQQVPVALRGEVMDATQEYSQFFTQLGFDGSQSLGLLVKGAEDGQYGIDKFGDSIKEFTIRATDMSASSGEAYKKLGLDQRAFSNALLEGGDTAKAAFDQIVQGLLDIEDPAAQAEAAIGLFGTPLEDLGVGEIPEFLTSLGDMRFGLGDVAGAAEEMADAVGGTTSQKIEAFRRKALGKLADFTANVILPRFEQLVDWASEKIPAAFEVVSAWVQENWPPIRDVIVDVLERIVGVWKNQLQPALAAMGEGIAKAFGWVIDNKPVLIGVLTALGVGVTALFTSWALGAASAALATAAAMAPFIAIGAAIAAVTAGVIYAYQNWEWFRTAVDAVREWMVGTLWPAIQDVFGWLRDNVPPIVQAVAGFFSDVLWPAMQKVWDFVVTYLWPAFRSYAEFLIGAWKTAFDTAVTVVTTLWGWLQTLWDRSEGVRAFLASAFVAGVSAASTAIGVVSTAVSTLWGWLQTLWDRAEPVRAFLAGAFWLAITTIGTAFDAISTAVSTVWGWFQTVWDKGVEVAGYFEGAFGTMLGGVTTAFDAIGTAIGAVRDFFQALIDKAKAAAAPILAVRDALDAVSDKLGGNVNSKKIGEDFGKVQIPVPGKERGGPVVAGMPYVVGEKRPELFVPSVNGTIIPRVPDSIDVGRLAQYDRTPQSEPQPMAMPSTVVLQIGDEEFTARVLVKHDRRSVGRARAGRR